VSAVAHFFVVVNGSKIHERAAHFFIDIYTNILGDVHFAEEALVVCIFIKL